MTRKALALGIFVALLACGPAQASDEYKVTAGGDQDWGPSGGGLNETSSTQLDKTGTMTGDNNAVGNVHYHVQAGPGITRAALHGDVTVPSNLAYPFNPSLQAVATTELTINGPDFEVNTSVNLHVDGIIETPVCGDGRFCGALEVFINAPTPFSSTADFTTLGETRANSLGLTFDPVPGGYHVHGDVTSKVFGVRTGTPTPIGIVLNLSGRFGGNPATSTFGGSFDDPARRMQVSFATSGPVLNLPAGYSVSGPAVVNNRWDDPFSDDVVVTNCNAPSLAQMTTVPGSLVLRCNAATFPNLTHIGGDVVIDGDHAPHLGFPGPVVVDGSVRVVGNDGGGDLDLDDTSVGGVVDVSGNSGDLDVDIGSTGGSIDISGNSGDLDIDPGATGGDLDISDNPGADVINVGGGEIAGDLTITDNGNAVVNANDSVTVSGDAEIESTNAVTATTAGGTTDVTILGGTAAMHAVLPDGTFDQPVAFTITRHGDEPAEGQVDPLAGYDFDFAVPALSAEARLTFTIDLAALDAGTRAALLAGIASGSATIVSKADAPGSAYAAFARCTGTQTPEANGCVAVTTDTAFARFDVMARHFSTWAVALVRPRGGTKPPVTIVTAAQIRALLRTEITPDGQAAKIPRLLKKRGYRLHFRALTAGTAKVRWYRVRKGRKAILIATGTHAFASAGSATFKLKLTVAGRRQLRHAKRLRLTARGTFTPATGGPVRAARTFALRR